MASSIVDELRKLKALLDDGILSQEEYNLLKNRLINSYDSTYSHQLVSESIKGHEKRLDALWDLVLSEVKYPYGLHKGQYFHPESMFYERQKVADAYAISTAISLQGLSPENFTNDAIIKTIETTDDLVLHANSLVGQSENSDYPSIGEVLAEDGFRLMEELQVEDLSPMEISKLNNAYGIDLSPDEFNLLLENVRRRGRKEHKNNDTAPHMVFIKARKSIRSGNKKSPPQAAGY